MVQQCVLLVALVAAVGVLMVQVDAGMPTELEVETITKGESCENPTKNNDVIFVHFEGKLHPDLGGKEFATTNNQKPYKFQLGSGREIKGWDLGLLNMCPGERRKISIPPKYGYDTGTKEGVPAGATIVFVMELVAIEEHTWHKSWAGIQIMVVFSLAAMIWMTIWKGTSDGVEEPRGPKAAYKRL